MIEILDDNFYESEPVEKIDLPEEEKDPFIEYLHIKSRDIEVVSALLEEEDVPYHIQQKSSFDNTGILPLTTSQLDDIKMVVFVPKSSIPRVRERILEYNAKKEIKPTIWEIKDFTNIALVIVIIGLIFVLIFVNFF